MKKVLDFGCGAGSFINYLAKKDRDSLFFGVDIDKSIINRAKKNKLYDNEKFFLSDGDRLPFDDDFFDEVYCYEVLEHVKELDKVLKDIKRVIKKGGVLRVSVPLRKSEMELIKYNPDYPEQIGHRRFFSKDKLREELKNAGFKVKSHTTCNAIEHLYWKHVFSRGGKIVNQLGEVDKRAAKWMRISSLAFSRELLYNIDQTKNKKYRIVMHSFFLLYPFVILLDLLFLNKKQKVVAVNGG